MIIFNVKKCYEINVADAGTFKISSMYLTLMFHIHIYILDIKSIIKCI